MARLSAKAYRREGELEIHDVYSYVGVERHSGGGEERNEHAERSFGWEMEEPEYGGQF